MRVTYLNLQFFFCNSNYKFLENPYRDYNTIKLWYFLISKINNTKYDKSFVSDFQMLIANV